MPSLTSDARFFGFDLKQMARQLAEPWERASAWPILSWLTPPVCVRVLHSDGSEMLWVDGKPASNASAGFGEKAAGGIGFVAIEVPEDLVLQRVVRLPAMGAADRSSALALEARTASPFALADLVWGASSTVSPLGAHTLVLASRKQLMAYQGGLAARVPAGAVPEQWVFDESGQPLVLAGFGEPRRTAYITRWRRAAAILLASAVLIAICILLTPSIKLKLRADQAHAAYAALAKAAAPALARREALVGSADQLNTLQKRLAERIDPLRLLEALTRAIPDDAALQSLRLIGTKVTLAGYASNASNLMQTLGNQPGMREVRAPSAATRMTGAQKESFVIEFTADPTHFGVVGGPPIVAAVPAAMNITSPAGLAIGAGAMAPPPQSLLSAPVNKGAGQSGFGGTTLKRNDPASSAPSTKRAEP